jgi:D-threo-aldose 1-dehydrogenase
MRASDRRPLGNSGLNITVLGFGTTAIGNLYKAQTPEGARATVDAAWDAGVRYFDTAPLYGLGLSETRLGEALAGRTTEGVVISSKVGRVLEPLAEGASPIASAFYMDTPAVRPLYDYSRDGVLRSFAATQARLGRETIDLLLLHDLAPHNHGGAEAYEDQYRRFFEEGGHRAMVELREQGLVKALGVGVGDSNAAERLVRDGDFQAVLLAGRYTLLEQDALTSFLPLCVQRGVGVVIGGPYNSGILATGPIESARYNYRPASPEILTRVGRIEAICRAHGVSLTAAALQFPMHHPAVASTIPGLGTPHEVAAAVDLLGRTVSRDCYDELKAEGLLDRAAPVG